MCIIKIKVKQLAQYQICNEIDAFNKANEETLRMQGTFDVDQLIEESIMQEYELEEYLQQEQVEYCVNCQNEVLTYQQADMLLCSNCGFYTTKDCFEKTILPLLHRHALDCQGKIGFCLEPGTDNTLFANCDICDLWDILYM